MPQELIEQLSPGGIMVIPVEDSIFKVVKDLQGSLRTYEYPGFVFVPLVTDDL